MNWDQIKGNWMQVKGKVKEKWGQLTDDDLTSIAGRRDQLAGILQKSLRLRQGAGGEGTRRLPTFPAELVSRHERPGYPHR